LGCHSLASRCSIRFDAACAFIRPIESFLIIPLLSPQTDIPEQSPDNELYRGYLPGEVSKLSVTNDSLVPESHVGPDNYVRPSPISEMPNQ
jgi:hypothetical protein